ncbi:sensor histidine kinase [Qipengyuania sediminis]|uniref:sensor histidine kinase n=1 Tax=Qipengyuania sediminis TaxID=1532023 RepID=UPI00105A531F|nr:HAMP domain-containing sensor histidine kinase [Qipengyuania sediminis]
MSVHAEHYLATGRVDREGRLTEAGEPLARLQADCGGRLGGPLAIPELRALVDRAKDLRLALSRSFTAVGEGARIEAWADVRPLGDGEGGCTIGIQSWQCEPSTSSDEDRQLARIRREMARSLPEFSARLDPEQRVLAVETTASDLVLLSQRMAGGAGRPWTDFVTLTGTIQDQPLHWRLLDGAACAVAGSARRWTAWLEPLGRAEPGSAGFLLTLVTDQAAPVPEPAPDTERRTAPSLGEELAPALRQPINRVLTQAETIRSKLAGPLPDIYAGYAGDIVDAGEHLTALIEDIADLEGVEDSAFSVEPTRIDLGEAARQACGILGVRAHERGITLVPPPAGESQWARGEFRRVVQVLINLVGNAIAYSPRDSQVWVRLDREGRTASVCVADQGRGLNAAEQARVFDKFERLGRSDAAGSGLGLYISARLARAMEGDLTVESAPGQGARFTLTLPAA